MPPWEGALFGVSGQLKSIVKNRILALCKRVSCAKNEWTDFNDVYVI